MATPLMPLHITPYAERLSTPGMRAAERLLPRVTVGVDAEARRSRKRLVACSADVAVLVLLEGARRGGCREVVVVLPGGGGHRSGQGGM